MGEAVWDTSEIGQEIGITTTGRKSGRPHRREVRFYNLDDRLYITGSPGRRDWYANLLANPKFTVHLKNSVQAEFIAQATFIQDEAQRRRIISVIHERRSGSLGPLEAMVVGSPLIEFHIDT